MLQKIANHWWLYVLRGLVAIAFGIVAIVKPGQALLALVLVFGAFALVSGVLALVASFSSAPYYNQWWLLLLDGLAGIVVGLIAIFEPGITKLALLILIAIWAIVTGILEIVVAIHFRQVLTGEWVMILGGVLSIALGVLLFIFPGAGEISLIWVIGIYAIAFGISEIVFGFQLNNLWHKVEKAVNPAS